jgi:endoglucanase
MTFLFVLISLLAAYGQSSDDIPDVFKVNERLGRGINVSGYGRLQADDYKAIKETGFSNVRIPIHPFNQTLGDENFTLKPVFLETLDTAIERALDNGLVAIIDLHEHHAMESDPLGEKPKFLAIWKQLAEHYKDAPKEVLFEIANEPNMKPEIWNKIHHEAHQIIRESNPDRTILIGSINGNQIMYLKDLELPEDDRNIIVTIHYYMPIQFTHQGAPWSTKNKDLSGIEWPGEYGGEKEIIRDFDIAQEWSKTHNRPLHLGEFGVYNKTDMESRVRWNDFVARQADERKWSWSYWELFEGFGIYSPGNKQWHPDLLNALIPEKKDQVGDPGVGNGGYRPGGFNSGHIVWRDEFDGSGLPDGTLWNINQWEPGRVNEEKQKYTDRVENLYCKGGSLFIEARNDEWKGYKITSGRIESRNRWAPPQDGSRSYRVEVRAKLAGGGGSWPAFWMLGNQQGPYGGWPSCGEIDIFEYVGNSRHFQCAVHDKSAINHTLCLYHPSDPEKQWHIYALNFYADRLEFYVDENKFHTFERPSDSNNRNWPYHSDDGNGFNIILNVAVGGTMGGDVDDADFPMVMEIDYVRVYER